MTSTSSRSTANRTTPAEHLGRTRRSRQWAVLAATIAAADLVLIGSAALAFDSGPATSADARFALASGCVLVAVGVRLQLTISRTRVFPCKPLASCSALLLVGAVGLWMWVLRAAPIDALLRRAPMADLATKFALFLVAATCTTLAFASAVNAWDARQQERVWGANTSQQAPRKAR